MGRGLRGARGPFCICGAGIYHPAQPHPAVPPELIWAIPPCCVPRWPRPTGSAPHGHPWVLHRSPWGEQPRAVSLLSPATSAVPIISRPEDPVGAGRAILGPPECQTGAVGELLCCSLCTPFSGVSAPDWGVGLVPQLCPQCPGRSHRATGMQPPGSRLRAVLLRFGDLILVLITSSARLALTSLLSEEISHA